jgi:hypothetical protein
VCFAGDFSKTIKYRVQDLAIAREVGDRAGEGQAYGNLGNAYQSQGDFKAIKYHSQHLAIAKEVGDRAGEGTTYGNLCNANRSQGDLSKAIEYQRQDLAIAKEVGDRAGEGRAYGRLGTGHMYLHEYVKAVAYLKAQHALAISLKLSPVQSDAALNMGVALTLHVRAGLQGASTGADQAPGPHSHSSASACLNDKVREAAKGSRLPSMVVVHLQNCTWRTSPPCRTMRAKRTRRWHISKSTSRGVCNGNVTLAPDWCWQTRGEDTPMLTCSGGCRVARFCSADYQKMASKKAALGGSLTKGRHKDICGVLSKWCEVVKDGVAPDSCTAELLELLQRKKCASPAVI